MRRRSSRGGKGDVHFAGKVLTLGRSRELSIEAAEYLGSVVRNGAEDTKHRVAAARCLVAHSQWREDRFSPELAFVRMFGGPAAALQYLAENQERLRGLLEPKLTVTAGDLDKPRRP